jgi:hypothetical protein
MPPGKASFIEVGGQRGGSVDQLWDRALEDTARVTPTFSFNHIHCLTSVTCQYLQGVRVAVSIMLHVYHDCVCRCMVS